MITRTRFFSQLLAAVLLLPGELFFCSADQPAGSPTALKSIVVLGDSLAAGYGLDPDQAFPALLQKRVERAELAFRIVNAGVSGDTTAAGLRRLDWILKRKVDVLVIELGGNDGLRGITPLVTRSNLTAIIERTWAQYPDTKILLAGMQMASNMGEDFNKAFRGVFTEVAKQHKIELIPFLLEGVGGIPELNQSDQIHPTASGHKIIAETVWKKLEPMLRRLHPPK